MVLSLFVRNGGFKYSFLMTFNGCSSNIFCHLIGYKNCNAMKTKDNIECGFGMHSAYYDVNRDFKGGDAGDRKFFISY